MPNTRTTAEPPDEPRLDTDHPPLAVRLSPIKVAMVMSACIVLLTVLSVAGHAAQFFYGMDRFVLYVRLFNISGEANIPTWFQCFGWVFAGMLCLLIAALRTASGQSAFRRHWQVLGFIFFYISIDDFSVIHEMAIGPIQSTLNTGGILLSAWVIPASILLVIFLAAYWRFLFHLPEKTRYLLVASGAIFVSGALGMELAGGYIADYHGDHTILRGGVATIEEFLEMSGIALTIFTLLTHIKEFLPPFQLVLGGTQKPG